MWGAIIGDILGSKYEAIPGIARRTVATPTDDSFLTCACIDWLLEIEAQSIDVSVLSAFSNIDDLDTGKTVLRLELKERAIRSLKKWYHYYPSSGFSRGFGAWASEPEFTPRHRHTNGVLMRQSPIAAWCSKNKLSWDVCEQLVRIFASPTHDHIEAYKGAISHAQLIYELASGEREKSATGLNNYIAHSNVELKTIEDWKHCGFFIWDTPKSLSIVYTVLLNSLSYDDVIHNCIEVGGDVDTYAAIAGPIGELCWGIPSRTKQSVAETLKNYPEIVETLHRFKY